MPGPVLIGGSDFIACAVLIGGSDFIAELDELIADFPTQGFQGAVVRDAGERFEGSIFGKRLGFSCTEIRRGVPYNLCIVTGKQIGRAHV